MDSSPSPSIEERPEIVFFDVETTIPSRKGQCFYLLEFGAILVCPRRLTELHHYSTLVKPADLFAVSTASVRCNGITRDAVATAPNFVEVADIVYEILHGRVWAGHNIVRFDCVRIREAFAAIGRPAPEPKGTIDTLTLLTERFGRRAGDMKMATLATYFGLGEQPHRTLGDVRMNLEVVKYCSTVLFLESCLPNILSTNSSVSPNTTTRSQTNKRPSSGERNLNTASVLMDQGEQNLNTTSSLLMVDNQTVSPSNANTEPLAKPSPFDMGPLIDQIKAKPKQTDARMEEIFEEDSPVISANAVANEGCSGYAGFFDPDEISVPSVSASLVSSYWGQRIQFLHKDVVLQLCCAKLRVRFGMSKKFVDSAGRPRLSFVVDSPSSVCRVLDLCDHLAQRLSVDSGSSSTWRPAVTRKNDFLNTSTIRLIIPAISNGARGNSSVYSTEIYQNDAAGTSQKLVFHKFDANQLGALFVQGAFLDAFFSLDVYDYQQSAGIRLVAKKLIIHT